MLEVYLQFHPSLVYKSSVYQDYEVIDGMLTHLTDSLHFDDMLN